MFNDIKKELLYGTRFLLRDNWLCGYLISDIGENVKTDQLSLNSYVEERYLYASLKTALKYIPYYSNIPNNFGKKDAIEICREYFPIIEKKTLLENMQLLYPNKGKAKPWFSIGKTSGTTGAPLAVFRSPWSVMMENAFVKRHWMWSGYCEGMKRASLRGDIVVELGRTQPPFWFFNRYNNQLLISSRHLQEEYFEAIVEKLDQFSPYMLQAYPSTAFTLASYLERRNSYLSIPYVFTSSEPLYFHQRELIEKRLCSKIMDMYGMAERVAFATECEYGEMHVNSDYSYVEIVNEEGLATDDYGYVIGTTFHNLVMPLVRYKLSDRTRWRPGKCQCGRPFPMIEKVTGKYEDSITGGNGMFVSPSILTFAFKGLDNIKKSQVAQIAPAHWEIRVVPTPEFSMDDERKLKRNIHELVDPDVLVDVILKEDIPNTSSGKFRWVINETSK